MLELRELRPEDEQAFRAAWAEFRAEQPPWDFAFHFDEQTDFKGYLDLLGAWEIGERLAPRFVPNSYFVGVVEGRIVGRVSLRHELNDFLLREGGHIGYGVVPSARRRGYASEMLRLSLPFARRLGLPRVLVTCDEDNIGSRKTIEANGGVLENTLFHEGLRAPKRRYWIAIPR